MVDEGAVLGTVQRLTGCYFLVLVRFKQNIGYCLLLGAVVREKLSTVIENFILCFIYCFVSTLVHF